HRQMSRKAEQSITQGSFRHLDWQSAKWHAGRGRNNRTIDADAVSRASCPRRNLDRMVSSRAIGYLLALLLSCTTMLAGCDLVSLRPSGYVAAQQGHLVVLSTLLMLLIVVPVIA